MNFKQILKCLPFCAFTAPCAMEIPSQNHPLFLTDTLCHIKNLCEPTQRPKFSLVCKDWQRIVEESKKTQKTLLIKFLKDIVDHHNWPQFYGAYLPDTYCLFVTITNFSNGAIDTKLITINEKNFTKQSYPLDNPVQFMDGKHINLQSSPLAPQHQEGFLFYNSYTSFVHSPKPEFRLLQKKNDSFNLTTFPIEQLPSEELFYYMACNSTCIILYYPCKLVVYDRNNLEVPQTIHQKENDYNVDILNFGENFLTFTEHNKLAILNPNLEHIVEHEIDLKKIITDEFQHGEILCSDVTNGWIVFVRKHMNEWSGLNVYNATYWLISDNFTKVKKIKALVPAGFEVYQSHIQNKYIFSIGSGLNLNYKSALSIYDLKTQKRCLLEIFPFRISNNHFVGNTLFVTKFENGSTEVVAINLKAWMEGDR